MYYSMDHWFSILLWYKAGFLFNNHHQINALLNLCTCIFLKYRICYSPSRLLLNRHYHQINAVLILRTSILLNLKYRVFSSPLRLSNKCPINPSNMSTFEAPYFRGLANEVVMLRDRINTRRLSSNKLTHLYFCHCLLRLLSYKEGLLLSIRHLINAELT